MRLSKWISTVAVLTLFSSPLSALSLKEAISVGLANDMALKASRYSESASLESVELQKSAKRPQVNLAYGYSYSKKQEPTESTASSFASIALNYNLFDGFATKYNVAGALENYKNSQFSTKASREDKKLSITQAYINVLAAKQTLKARKEAVELLEKNFKDTNSFYKQGLVAKNSVLETQVALSSAKQDLLSAKSSLNIAKKALSRRLGRSLKEEVIEDVTSALHIKEDAKALKDMAIANRSEIKQYESQARRMGYLIKATDAIKYPKVDAKLAQTWYGNDGFPDGIDDGPLGVQDSDTALELSVTYNLYDGDAAKSTKASYMYQQEALRASLEDLKLDISLQVDQAHEEYLLANESINVAKDRLAYAKENFYIVEKRYKVQIETTSTLLDARLDLTQAQVGYVNALYNVFLKQANLARVVEGEI